MSDFNYLPFSFCFYPDIYTNLLTCDFRFSDNNHDDRNSGTKNSTRAAEKTSQVEIEDDEVLDCGKAVNFTYYDNLVGVNNRQNHPHVPEPQVALIFKKKSAKNADLDVDALERKLKKAKREVDT